MPSESKIKVGNLAPAFSLTNQKGDKISLKNFRGSHNVIVYFYPKAMTPGCTVQAQGIRDGKRQLAKYDAVVLGISPDSPERLAKFEEKEKLNFHLLADEDRAVAEKFGVWAKKKNYGKEYMGIVRTTFVIGKDGRLHHVLDKVKTKSHLEDLLPVLAELS